MCASIEDIINQWYTVNHITALCCTGINQCNDLVCCIVAIDCGFWRTFFCIQRSDCVVVFCHRFCCRFCFTSSRCFSGPSDILTCCCNLCVRFYCVHVLFVIAVRRHCLLSTFILEQVDITIRTNHMLLVNDIIFIVRHDQQTRGREVILA